MSSPAECSPPKTTLASPPSPTLEQSWGEEVLNGLSHGLGLTAALVAAPAAIRHAAARGDTAGLIGASVFAATVVVLYLASVLYHLLPTGPAKRAFHVIDHSAIFLLIAGTYTPFTLGVLRGAWGWTLLALVWGLALVGVGMKILGGLSHPWVSIGLYLFMGWLVLIAIRPMFARVPGAGLLWLAAGGLAYTLGVAFYLTDHRLRYGHFIWHLFVLAGTACHYYAVLEYAA